MGPAYERWVAAHDPVDPGDRGETRPHHVPAPVVLREHVGDRRVPDEVEGVVLPERYLLQISMFKPRERHDSGAIDNAAMSRNIA